MALESKIPDDIKYTLETVKICKHLNNGLGTSYYNPETIREVPQGEIDDLIIAITFENIA
jgi:hypothetical protein